MFYNFRYTALKSYAFIAFIVVTVVFINIISSKDVFPSHIDESSYFSGAKVFAETGSLKSFSSINEERSKIGEYNWYGPVINYIYGGIAKVFGFNNYYFLIINYSFYFLSFFFIKLLSESWNQFFRFSAIFVSTYASSVFIFTYFPENLIILLSIILLLLYLKSFNNKKMMFVFLLFILIFSTVRMTLLFWVFGILAFDYLKLKYRISIVLIVFALGLCYMKLFTAPSSILGLGDVHNSGTNFNILHSIQNLFKNFMTNLYRLYDRVNSSIIVFLTLLLLSIYGLYENRKDDIKTLLGLLFIVLISFVAFLFLYSTYWFFFEKQIAFTLPILIYILLKFKKQYNVLLLFSFFIFFPITITKARDNVINKKLAFVEVEKFRKEIKTINKFRYYLKPNRNEVNVLFFRSDYNLSQDLILSTLPTSFKTIPILYTSSVCEVEAVDSVKYKVHNKIEIDYCITSKEINLSNFKLVYSNNLINLYQNIKTQKKIK